MSDDNVSVKFGSDVAGVTTGGSEVKGVIAGIMDGVKALSDQFKAMGGAAVAGFGEATAAGKETVAAIKEVGETMAAAREAVAGIGEAFVAAFAIEQVAEFAEKMAETAEGIAHTATTFGLTTSEVQKLKAEAAGAGVPFDAVTGAMQRLDRSMLTAKAGSKSTAEAFKAIGIDINQSLTQLQLFDGTLAGLAAMDDGPAKVGLAMAVLGKNIQAIGPLIGLTAAELDDLKQKAIDYGAVDEGAERKGLALAESFNTQKIAMQGVGNVMESAFAPALKAIVDDVNALAKAFVQSYNSGGEAKVIMDVLAVSVKALIAVVDGLVTGIAEIWDISKGVWSATVAVFNSSMQDIEGDAKALAQVFVDVGQVIYDALSNNMAAGAQAVEKTISDTAAAAKQMGADLAKELKAGADASKANFAQAAADTKAFYDRMQALMHDTSAPLPKEGTGTTALDPTRQQHEHKPKEDEALKDAVRDIIALNEQQARQHAEMVRQFVSDNQDAARSAISDINDELAARKEAIEQQLADVADAEKQGTISHAQALAQEKALIEQEKKAAIDAADQILAVRIASDEAIKASSGATSAAYIAAQRDEVAANAARNKAVTAATLAADKQIATDTRRTTDQIKASWHSYIDPVVSSFGSAISQMIAGTETFRQAIAQIGQSILQVFIGIAERMVENWIVNLIVAKTAQQTTATSQVGGYAAVAGAAGVASMAGAPFPIDLGAAAFGTAMSQAALAFGSLASFDIGAWNLPSDMPAMVHKGEHVIPVGIARPMARFFESGPGAAGGGAQALPWGGGETHNHYHLSPTINAVDGRSVRQFFSDHGASMMDELHARAKNGTMPKWANSPR